MSTITIFAVYFVIWWVTFVAMANIGEVTQAESGNIVPGTPAGAPQQVKMWRKLLWVTLVSAVIMAFIYWVIVLSGWTLDDYPFMPDYIDYK